MTRSTIPSKKGFTLIELLVVIAIIAILAAILFPVFARARENARRTSCLSNVKQMGLGVMQYTQDYDEYYPPGYLPTSQPSPDGTVWFSGTWFWQQVIYPYTKSRQVYFCPSAVPLPSNYGGPYAFNYGANQQLMPSALAGVTNLLNMAALQRSSETFMIMDFGGYDPHPTQVLVVNGPAAYGWRYLPGANKVDSSLGCLQGHDYTRDCEAAGRHFDGVNMAYADGHAKWIKSSLVVAEARKFRSGVNPNSWNPRS